MLDEKDIQAIAQLLAQQKDEIMQEMDQRMDARFAQQKQEIDQRMDTRFAQQKDEIMQEMDQRMDARFAQQKQEIMHEVGLLMEGYFDPKFNALSDSLEILKEKCLGREELETVTDRVDVVEAVVKIHSRDIEELKKAQ